MVLLWLALYNCLSCLAAIIQKEFWIFLSRSLMARSISNATVVQEAADDFCRLYCRPRSRMACSSFVNLCWLLWQCEDTLVVIARGVYAMLFSFVFLLVCLAFCSMCHSKPLFPVARCCQLCLAWMARSLAIGLCTLGAPCIAVHWAWISWCVGTSFLGAVCGLWLSVGCSCPVGCYHWFW